MYLEKKKMDNKEEIFEYLAFGHYMDYIYNWAKEHDPSISGSKIVSGKTKLPVINNKCIASFKLPKPLYRRTAIYNLRLSKASKIVRTWEESRIEYMKDETIWDDYYKRIYWHASI
jgi:hypothetical protein